MKKRRKFQNANRIYNIDNPLRNREGVQFPMAKLTQEQRRQLIDLVNSGMTQAMVAKLVGTSRSNVSRIFNEHKRGKR